MLAGSPPFDFRVKKALSKKDRNLLMKQIINAKISKPRHASKQAWSLIQGLLSRDPTKRLGSGGSEDVKKHPFFKCVDWVGLEERRIPSTFKPSVSHSLCVGEQSMFTQSLQVFISSSKNHQNIQVSKSIKIFLLMT